MTQHVKNRRATTRIVETGDPINYRILAEIAAKKILEGECKL